MSRVVAVGLDGSSESRAAADWAAREARMYSVALRVVHADDLPPHAYVPFAGEQIAPLGADRSAALLRESVARLAHRHPGLPIEGERLPGHPASALVAVAEGSELLALGSRGLGRAAGFLLGSVAAAVVARAGRPVVLVRAEAASEYRTDASGTATTAYRDVVLGLDLGDPDDTVIAFAFDAAARRATGLRVVHGRGTPRPGDSGTAGGEQEPSALLAPWRDKFPGVEVTEEAVVGRAGARLVDASLDASLVVVGRRVRRAPLAPHVGPVTYAVVRRSVAPVAVVPHL
ncbi:universal stress protein [Streptomyces akebiae]|uniref:Universal stress protein n=1 Tax=Streptomyces akebiae TaxID=2865673 RepID=A0ABX8XHQ5_9ACTN|nr:universal stress protein [Streptomyces akebiae]QYX75279.1 universal stress protein [Streptomyces akebiae]